MKTTNKIIAVSILAMLAVPAAHAKIVAETMLSETSGHYSSTHTVQDEIDAKQAISNMETNTSSFNVDSTTKYPSMAVAQKMIEDQADNLSNDISTLSNNKQDKLNSGTGGNVVSSGNGNVVTAVSAENGVVTVTKGTTLGSLATKSTVASSDITNGTIAAEDLASNAVTTVKITNKNVTAPKLADGVVASGSNNVTVSRDSSTGVFSVSVAETDISGKVDKTQTTKGGILTTNASTGAVEVSSTIASSKVSGLGSLATKSTVASSDITNGTIAAEDLASNAVTTVKITDKNVTAPKLADGVVASGSDNVTVSRDSSTGVFSISVAAQDVSGKEDKSNKVTVTSGTGYDKTSTTLYPSMKTANQIATDAINALDVSTATNGGTANNVVTAVTETNGKISVTKGDAVNAVAATASSGTGNVITGISLNADGHTLDFQKGITALQAADIAGKQNIQIGAAKSGSTASTDSGKAVVVDENGKIAMSDDKLGTLAYKSTVVSADITDGTITTSDIKDGTITTSDISNSAGITKTQLASTVQTSLGKADTALQASNVTSTYSATGTAPVNGTAVASAISNLNSGGTYEVTANKVTSVTSSSTDTQYPSAKAVNAEFVERNLPDGASVVALTPSTAGKYVLTAEVITSGSNAGTHYYWEDIGR